MKKINKPTVVSLFAGAGGMDLGFQRAGFKIIWANDNFQEAAETYQLNIGHGIDNRAIEEIDLDEIPAADIVIGGFPCQGFSIANMNRHSQDKRNILYTYFVKIVKAKKPKFFVAENVKGILSMEGGKAIERIIQDFKNVGYRVRYTLLNVADFGVPQSRQRVIILGTRNDLEFDISFPPPPTHGPTTREKHKTIGEALQRIPRPDEPHDLKNHIFTKHKPKFNGFISNRKVDPDKPSPTITARGDGKGGAMIMNHPFDARRLSCRELATIQGFPMDFEFVGSMTAIYRQIGNAVPPPFAEAIARSVLQGFLSKSNPTAASNQVKKSCYSPSSSSSSAKFFPVRSR